MLHRFSALVVGLVLAIGVLIAQSQTPGPMRPAGTTVEQWDRAVDAWEAGEYPAALEALRAVMKSPDAAAYLERVALLTGELFVTTEITTDGRNPRISANGQFATYEAGPTATPVTRLVRVGPTPQVVAELPTTTVAFDRAGRRVAWLRAQQPGDPAATEIVVRDLASGAERVVLSAGLQKTALAWAADDESVFFVGAEAADPARSDVYRVKEGSAPVRLTDLPGHKTGLQVDTTGTTLVYQSSAQSPFGRGGGPGRGGAGAAGRGAGAAAGAARGGGAAAPPAAGRAGAPPPQAGQAPAGRAGGGGGRGGGGGTPPTFGIVNLAAGTTRTVSGTALTMSADGRRLAWLSREGDVTTLNASPASGGAVTAVRSGRERMEAPVLSPDGSQIAYQLMTHTDWEIYLSAADGSEHRRLTRDIQHDVLPRFLTTGTLLGLMGEPRHRRSQVYDLATGTRTRLFSNNTVRTISPEYTWTPSADGQRVIIQADRDGDTVSTERGVSIVDLTRRVSAADVLARIDRQLATENDLRQRMVRAFKPVDALAREVVGRARINRVFGYEKALFDFDSKNVSQPGNAKAIEYLEHTYRSFGYTPEVQWFQPQQAQGRRTANVVATLRGTEDPHLIYVVSSHFDSVAVGPGADDDTSGTAALLEAARILAASPLPTTVVFASFTGEESGLLGSREFVRRAAEGKWQVIGALNNDMIGWGAEGSRMDNTIRYSNPGIRDIQHGAAFQYTDLVLFDAKYYRGTDAAAFYEAWGDIVGGIGSYPVLANPNYHQPTDFLETMNHRQIMETAKVTASTLVYLASSPSRLKDLKAGAAAGGVEVTWAASPESSVRSYVVAYGPASDPLRTRTTVSGPRATLPALPAGTHIAVKAVNSRGLEGWDWARTVIQ